MKQAAQTIFLGLVFLLMYGALATPVLAIEDPHSVPNNKFGIHILFPSELEQAANLVNSNGGDWGYIVIPIQSGDKDLEKWQAFMDSAKKLHVIPIVRLATEGDYFNTKVWRKPNDNDIADFANFLNSLDWPVKNRYIIVYNEVNRSDEWGGEVSPAEYAQLLSFTTTVFKSKSPDFFIISAGLDNAAPNKAGEFMNEYDYLQAMDAAVPGVFRQIDGFASHSYPNPGFSQPPTRLTRESIGSFEYEKSLLDQLSSKNLPVFITETGWSNTAVLDTIISNYYKQAFSDVWSNDAIVTVSPFLLSADSGPFAQFAFVKAGSQTPQYTAVKELSKIKGKPSVSEQVLAESTNNIPHNLPVKDFSDNSHGNPLHITIPSPMKQFFEKMLHIK